MTYWEKRAVDAIGRMETSVNGALPELTQSFEAARGELNGQIERFFARYAQNNGITLADAQKQLSLAELKNFKGDLAKFETLAKSSIGTFNLEVDNLSVKARITRLEALQTQCDGILQKLYQAQRDKMAATAKTVYNDAYYHHLFDIEQYTGFQHAFSRPATSLIEQVIAQPVQGMDISQHLWRQDIDTGFKIRQTLGTMFATGKPPQYFADSIAKTIGAVQVDKNGRVTGGGKKYEAYRLLYNESAHCVNQAQLQAYKNDDIEEYQNIATLDKSTCDICGYQDGKHYPVDKAVEGDNHPSFHCSCRCTTGPYLPELAGLEDIRAARDPETGESGETSAKTYQQWAADRGILRESGAGTVDTRANDGIIGSEDYRDKFDILSKNKANSVLCRETRRIIRQNSGSAYESASIVDGNGNIISKQHLGLHGGTINLDCLDGLPDNSVALTHNHPQSKSFSDDDIASLLDYPQIQSMIAAGHDGTVYTLSIGDGKRLGADENTGENVIVQEFRELYSRLGDSDTVVKSLSHKYGWRYEKA